MTELFSPMYDRRWLGLGLLFLAQMMVIGITSYGFGLFVYPLSQAYGLSRADANSGLIFILIGMALWSPIIGKALDRHSPIIVLVTGALAFGAGAVAIAFSTSLVVSALAAVTLLAAGTAALGPLTASTLTARWFAPRTGKAIGIISVSASLGGFVMVPTLSMIMEALDWRAALGIAGAVVAVGIAMLTLLIVKNDQTPSTAAQARRDTQKPASSPLKSRSFWCLVIIVGSMMAISQAILSTLIPYAEDQGFSTTQASTLISVIAISSVAGKLTIGMLLEKINLRLLQLAVILCLAAFLAILFAKPGYAVLLASCLIGGIAVGGTLPLWIAFVAKIFGVAAVGSVMGLMTLVQMPFTLVALRFVGASYDMTGHYNMACITFGTILPFTILALLILRTSTVR